MPNFSSTETDVISLFEKGKVFTYREHQYKVIKCGKPRPSSGECKTDVYLDLLDIKLDTHKIYKISIKQTNADFLENKMSYDRAVEIFGAETNKILTASLAKIKTAFENDFLVYFQSGNKTAAKTLKLGWKFELLNKIGGNKSGILQLTDSQKLDVYSGTNLSKDKKDARIEGDVIPNSGIADYLLEVQDTTFLNIDECLNSLQPLKDYAPKQDIYFACKALNYRIVKDKWDGDRPLSVWVDWYINDEGLLDCRLRFDAPLQVRGNKVGEQLRKCLETLKIRSSNFEDLKKKLSKSINIYP